MALQTRRTMAALAAAAGALAAGPGLAQPAKPPPSAMAASAARPILLVAQIRTGPFDPALAPQVEPLKTMRDVEQFLRAKGIPYARGRAQLDTRAAPKELVDTIAGLPSGEIFILPQGEAVIFNQVVRALTPQDAELIENW